MCLTQVSPITSICLHIEKMTFYKRKIQVTSVSRNLPLLLVDHWNNRRKAITYEVMTVALYMLYSRQMSMRFNSIVLKCISCH